MNYEYMSYFEINSAVAVRELWKIPYCDDVHCDDETGVVSWSDGVKWREFDPCYNPSDSWPIIMKNKIDIQHRDGFNIPCAKHREYMHADKNPLRAAMIVFLMMGEDAR